MQAVGTRTRGLIRRYMLDHNLVIENMDQRTDSELLMILQEMDKGFRAYFVQTFLVGLREEGSDHQRERDRAERIIEINRLDKTYLEITNPGIPAPLETFDGWKERLDHPSVMEAYEAVQDWMKGMKPNLITLTGRPGVGKSRLAIAAAQELYAQGVQIMYREEPAMLRSLQGAIKSDGTEGMLEELEQVPWLVLEELGMTASSAWGNEVIDRIINARWKAAGALRTLITTNQTAGDLPARIVSRLGDMQRARVILIDAPDYRTGRDWRGK